MNLNDFLNRAEIATALLIIAFVLVFVVFRKQVEDMLRESKRKSSR